MYIFTLVNKTRATIIWKQFVYISIVIHFNNNDNKVAVERKKSIKFEFVKLFNKKRLFGPLLGMFFFAKSIKKQILRKF